MDDESNGLVAEGESDFRVLAEAAFEGLFVSEAGTILYANSAGARLFGYDGGELVGRPISALTAPESQDVVASHIRDASTASYEAVGLRRDGSHVACEIQGRTLSWRGRRLRLTAMRDLTERRRSEQALRESEARFRRLVDGAPEPIGVIREGRFAYVNAQGASLLGFDQREDLVGRSVLDFIAPQQHALLRARLHDRVAGATTGRQEYEGRRKDGSTFLMEVASIGLELDGEPVVVGFIRDQSERRQIEARLLQADRLATLGMLAAGVAHEINNPLTYVAMSLRAIADTLPHLPARPERMPALVQALGDAREGVERVATIVRDLRSFAPAREDPASSADLGAAIGSALRLVHHEIVGRAELVTDLPDLPPVRGSVGRLGQVLLNLLVNAVQALPEGDARHQRIEISAVRRDDTVVLTVRDSGQGIAPEVLPHVFDPFFTTKPRGVGTGLGLFICKELVTGMGGTIAVDSKPNEGTTFTIELRVATAQPTRDPES